LLTSGCCKVSQPSLPPSHPPVAFDLSVGGSAVDCLLDWLE
jgi:hypothetical protein